MTNNKKIIYSLAFGNFAASISAMMVAGLTSEMAKDLEVSIALIGHLISVFAITYAISAPILAALTGKIDRKKLLILGMLGVLIGNAMITIGTNYVLLFTGRIIAALGAAVFTPLTVLVGISVAAESEKGKVSSLVFTGSAVATAIGIPLGAYIGITFGWQYSFAAVVVLAFLSILCMQLTLPKNILTPISNFNTLIKVFQHKALLLFLSLTVFQFGGQMVLFAFISPWLQTFTKLQASGISLILILVGLGGIIGNIIAGKATDNYGPKKVQLLLIIALALIMPFLVVIEKSVYLGGFLFFLWGFVGQGFFTPQLIRIVNINPDLSSASLSLNSSFINIGISFGAIVASIFINITGISSLTWIALGIILLSLAIFLYSWKMD